MQCCYISRLDGAVKEFEGGGEVQREAGSANRKLDDGETRHDFKTKRLVSLFQTCHQSPKCFLSARMKPNSEGRNETQRQTDGGDLTGWRWCT